MKDTKVTKRIQDICHLCPDKYFGSDSTYITHDHYFEKLFEELPAKMDQFKCPECSYTAAKIL